MKLINLKTRGLPSFQDVSGKDPENSANKECLSFLSEATVFA